MQNLSPPADKVFRMGSKAARLDEGECSDFLRHLHNASHAAAACNCAPSLNEAS